MPGLFAITIFTSSFLLFLVQPLLSKYVLPWFGGTPAVWTASLLFYQMLLCGGYAYAHLTTHRWASRPQGYVHLGLLGLSLAFLPVIPAARWQPSGTDDPILLILGMLTVTVGVPVFILAGTGPLLQVWFSRGNTRRSPYSLFAVSNAGSLLALVGYPLLVERFLSSRQQAWLWSMGYLLLVLLVGACLWTTWRRSYAAPTAVADKEVSATRKARSIVSVQEILIWGGWATVGVTVMMAVSLQLCQNIVTVPFLWVLPLLVYLLSFVLTFSGERWYPRAPAIAALFFALVALVLVIPGRIARGQEVLFTFSASEQVIVYTVALLVVSIVCHGELFRRRPATVHLTRFYLAIAGGGAAGGILVGAVAPAFFGMAHELYLGLAVVPGLLLLTRFAEQSLLRFRSRFRWQWGVAVVVWLGWILLLIQQAASLGGDALFRQRNFFGTVSVTLHDATLPAYRRLVMRHGITKHGAQYLQGTYRKLPVTYYSPFTGVGLAITALGVSLGPDGPMHVGVVGLGVGTLAAYGRPGDTYRFYEINPAVVELAQTAFDAGDPDLRFTYLSACQADVEIVLGDARLQLERERERDRTGGRFDVLVLDAFDSGAIPVHLLTREAFALYAEHLKPTGVLAVHISNKHLDLAPVVARLADGLDFDSLLMTNRRRDFKERPELECDVSDRAEWMILHRNVAFAQKLAEFSQPLLEADELEVVPGARIAPRSGRIWTDQYNNLFEVLRE